MQLHASADSGSGSLVEALAAAQRLLKACTPAPSSGGAAPAPREVTACVYRLVSTHGLQGVRAAQRTLGEPHASLNHIFHEVVQWQVMGWDR